MSRTAKLKLAHLFVVVILGAAAIAFLISLDGIQNRAYYLFLLVITLAPGRINGHYWREFYKGRRLLTREAYSEALPHFMRFLEITRARPGLKHLVWFVGSVYTRDIEVMTLNNIGAIHLMLGDLDKATAALEMARERDPEMPHIYYNLSVIAMVRREPDRGERLFDESRRLGYRGTWDDRLIKKAGVALAEFEGRAKHAEA